MKRRQIIPEQREGRDAIHNRRLKKEAFTLSNGQLLKFVISVNDRTLVGRDGMGSVLKRGLNMTYRWLSTFDIERRSLEHNLRVRGVQPLASVPAHAKYGRKSCRRNRFGPGQQSQVQPGRIGHPAQPPRSHPSNPHCNPALTQLGAAISKQTHQRAVHITEAQQAEVVVANGRVQSG